MFYNIKNKIRSVSHENTVLNKIYSLANKVKVNLLSGMSDERFAKMKYKENTGHKLNLENPSTFNEKLWWLKINNRDPLLTVCSDKVKVRGYVEECELGHILNETYGVYDDANDIDFTTLPDRAFIKVNHGSGTNIIWDKSNPFDKQKFIKKFNKSLKSNYYLQSREWNYKNIEPKIMIEKILEDKNNTSLVDYRFFCFDGVAKIIFVDIETAAADGSHSPYAKRNIYDTDFNCLDIKVKRERFDESIVKKPKNLKQMIEYAEKLSAPFPFCRVDLYNIDGNIYFGETTFYPGGGTQIVAPEKWEQRMGDWIDLDSEKIKKDTRKKE